MSNLNPNCVVGDVAVLLYEISSKYAFFRVGEEVTIVAVINDGYQIKRSYSQDLYHVDKIMLMRKDNWSKLRKAVLTDAIRLLSE